MKILMISIYGLAFVMVALGMVAVLYRTGMIVLRRWGVKKIYTVATVHLLALLLAGGGALLGSLQVLETPEHPLSSLWYAAVLCQYLTGVLCYLLMLSISSRGYSLAILRGLMKSGSSSTIPLLREQYGQGIGVEGMIEKRIRGLVALGLLKTTRNQVGPLTSVGRIPAVLASFMRRMLKLQNVG